MRSDYLLVPILFAIAGFGQVSSSITAQPGVAQPQPPAAPAVQPEDRGTVKGQVISSATGEPLKKANLVLMRAESPPATYSAVTDTGGKFSIPDVDPGKYRLMAERNGFVRQFYGARGNNMTGQTLTLAPRGKITGLVFKLTPQAVISGHVFDEDGDPVPHVSVEALQSRYLQGKKHLLPRSSASTNDLGEYRIFGLPAGKYLLMAAYRNTMMGMMGMPVGASVKTEEGYAPVYYPAASEAANAAPLTLTPGVELRGTDLRLVKIRAVHVGGIVTMPEGIAGPGVMVMLLPRESGGASFSRNMAPVRDAQGHFEIHGVTAGAYVLVVNFFGNGLRYSGQQPLDVGNSNIDDVRISLAAPVDLAAHVHAEANAHFPSDQTRVMLQPVVTGSMGGGYGSVGVDGDVVLKNLAPAQYRATVATPPGFYVKSLRYGDSDALESPIDLSTGPPGQLDITLSPAGGEVDGSVKNDKGDVAEGATVTLIPDGPRRASSMFLKTQTTDQSGHFAFKDIAPGEYTVYAWDQIDPGAIEDPDFIKPFEDSGKKLKIEEKARENVDLQMISAAAADQQ